MRAEGEARAAGACHGQAQRVVDTGGLLERWQQGRAGEHLGQGAGLGLAIVAQYARLMGAELALQKADAAPGQAVRVVLQAV